MRNSALGSSLNLFIASSAVCLHPSLLMQAFHTLMCELARIKRHMLKMHSINQCTVHPIHLVISFVSITQFKFYLLSFNNLCSMQPFNFQFFLCLLVANLSSNLISVNTRHLFLSRPFSRAFYLQVEKVKGATNWIA